MLSAQLLRLRQEDHEFKGTQVLSQKKKVRGRRRRQRRGRAHLLSQHTRKRGK